MGTITADVAMDAANADTKLPIHPSICPIQNIPLEILLRITRHLTTVELGHVRLTCRSLEQSLHKSFTDEFFTRKQFMISKLSLETLIAISKSRFSWHLRNVYISVDHIDPKTGHRVLDATHRWLQKYLTEQHSLWDTGRVVALLAEAFRNLENLETVVLRDFNSHRRSRDGPQAQWSSYGAPTLIKDCNIQLNGHANWATWSPGNYANQLFKAIIYALGTAGARPKAIEVMERRGHRLQDYAYDISGTESLVLPVLHNLKRLHLCMEVTWLSNVIDFPNGAFDNVCLRQFLGHCINLEELRLNDKRDNIDALRRNNLKMLFQWLAGTTSAGSPLQETLDPSLNHSGPPAPLLPKLSNLSIGMVSATQNELINIITRFAPTLTDLEFWRIVLVPENHHQSDDILDNKTDLWGKFFKRLVAVPNLNLHHIKFGNLRQFVQDSNAGYQYWLNMGVKCDDDKNGREIEYTGTDWVHFVEHEIIPRASLNWDEQKVRPSWKDVTWLDEEDEDVDSEDEGEEEGEEEEEEEADHTL